MQDDGRATRLIYNKLKPSCGQFEFKLKSKKEQLKIVEYKRNARTDRI